MAVFPAWFRGTYEEFLELVSRVRDAGGFLPAKVEEKNVILFLGLMSDEEDAIFPIESPIQSIEELKAVVGDICFTPLFRKMLSFIIECYLLRQMPLLQGMPRIGKTYAYQTFKNLVYGPQASYIYLDCSSTTSEAEIFDAIRSAYTANAFLLVHHFDNLPHATQAIFRVLGGHRGDLAEEIHEVHLGQLRRGPKTFVGFEVTYPEVIKGKNTIEPGMARRVVWNAVPIEESYKMERGVYTVGQCPECWLNGEWIDLYPNTDDFFECSNCGLQLQKYSDGYIVLPFRGKGKIKPYSLPAKTFMDWLSPLYGVKGSGIDAKFYLFNNEQELYAYVQGFKRDDSTSS